MGNKALNAAVAAPGAPYSDAEFQEYVQRLAAADQELLKATQISSNLQNYTALVKSHLGAAAQAGHEMAPQLLAVVSQVEKEQAVQVMAGFKRLLDTLQV